MKFFWRNRLIAFLLGLLILKTGRAAETFQNPILPGFQFVGRRQTDLTCDISTRLAFAPKKESEEAGLVLRGNDKNHFEIGVTLRDGQRQVFFRKILDGKVVEPVRFEKIDSGDVVLSIKASPLACEFFHSPPHGRAKSLGTAPTRDLSSESLTDEKHFNYHFTGVFVGLYATGNGQANTVRQISTGLSMMRNNALPRCKTMCSVL